MKLRFRHFAYFICLVAIPFPACGPNGGIEAGNPDLKGKTVTLTPQNNGVTFAIEIIDETTAAASLIKADGFETIPTPYQQDGAEIHLTAAFSDGTQIFVTLTFDANANLLEASLILNGQPTPTDFQPGESNNNIGNGNGNEGEIGGGANAALLLSGALCERIVECNTVFTQVDCETNVEQVPGLAHQFGDQQNQTLAESAAAIENGELNVDVEALQECLAGIDLVTCETVQRDFNDEDPPNYNQIHKLVPKPICSQGILQSGGAP